MEISEKNYIPGFDLFRIVGCILVAATHHGFFRYFYDNMTELYVVLSEAVPVFFIISGYLSGRHFSRKRVFGQIIRYGILYLIIELGMQVIYFTKLLIETGEYQPLRFIVNVLKCFVVDNNLLGLTGQLWFIPVLLFAFFLNAWMSSKARRAVIVSVILLRVFFVFLGAERLLAVSTWVLDSIPLLGREIHATGAIVALNRYLTGILFTTIGFDIGTWKINPVHILLAGLAFGIFEVCVRYLNIAVVLLSIALFFGIKRLPGQCLRPVHLEISLYSVFMFFLHGLEKTVFYKCGGKSSVISFLLIIAINMLLTFFTAYMIRNRGRRISAERGVV